MYTMPCKENHNDGNDLIVAANRSANATTNAKNLQLESTEHLRLMQKTKINS